jgi:hypothetical protein
MRADLERRGAGKEIHKAKVPIDLIDDRINDDHHWLPQTHPPRPKYILIPETPRQGKNLDVTSSILPRRNCPTT